MPRPLVPFILAIFAVLAVPSGQGQAATAASAKQVNLRVSDLPKGFKQTMAHYISNSAAAIATHQPLKAFVSHGRVSSYVIAFTRAATKGATYIAGEVVVYRSPAGAAWEYTSDIGHPASKTISRIPGPRVGAASAAFSSTQAMSTKYATSTIYVVFRRGPFVASIVVQGKTGTVTASQAAGYARTVDARMRAVR